MTTQKTIMSDTLSPPSPLPLTPQACRAAGNKVIADFDPPQKLPAKRNKFAFACATLASMTSVLLGYDIGVMSGAAIYIKKDWELPDIKIEVLIGIFNIYCLFGSFAAGKTSDWIGRRYTIVLAGTIFFGGALLMGFATNYAFLMVGRFVAGIGVGYALMIAPVYTAEVSPASCRGFLTSFPEVFINAGILLGYVSNVAFSKLPTHLSWRFMLGVGAIPSIFLAFVVVFMPSRPGGLLCKAGLGRLRRCSDTPPIPPRRLNSSSVIEISAETTISDAVKVLSECNILSAPVTDPEKAESSDWRDRYLGIIDYSSIILWVLEGAELAAIALSASSATAAGLGAGALGSLGAVALGATGPAAVAGLTIAAIGAAAAGGFAAEKGMGKDAPTAASELGDDFYKVILQEEPFKSTKVKEIIKSFRSTPFLPVSTESNMLTLLLLLSKYRMRNVPVIEPGNAFMKNFITQSAVVRGLEGCRGRDWFDCIAGHLITDLGLPFMSPDQVVSIDSNELILEAFKRMKDNQIGGLPVLEGQKKKIVGNLSMRDIRYLLLKPNLFSNFSYCPYRHLTVDDFIKTVASMVQEVGRVSPAITCKSNATLGDVVHSLASKEVHRIYVVAEEDEVIGVITLRDVISCFIYEPPNYLDDYLGGSAIDLLNQ